MLDLLTGLAFLALGLLVIRIAVIFIRPEKPKPTHNVIERLKQYVK